MNNRNRHGNEERVTIKTFGDLVNEGNGIEVTGFPNKPMTWSLNFITVLDKGRNGRFIRSGVKVVNAQASADMPGMKFARLIDEAVLFIKESVQADADAWIERKQARENRVLEHGKQKTTPGLSKFTDGSKTEREAGKHLKHEQNLVSRRAADQERTSLAKSGKGR